MTYEVALILTVGADGPAEAAETALRRCTDTELEAPTLLVLPPPADGLGGMLFAQVEALPNVVRINLSEMEIPDETDNAPLSGVRRAGRRDARARHRSLRRIARRDGLADWNGTTDYWEGSETVTDAQGRIGLVCPSFHAWFSEDEHAPPLQPPPKPRIVITLAGGVVQAVNVSPELGVVEVVVLDYDVDGPDEPGQCVDAAGDRCYLLDCSIGHDVALPTPLDDRASPGDGHAPGR